MRSALTKLPSVQIINLGLKPPLARLRVDTNLVALQDVVNAVRKAGGTFDGKLMVHEDPKLSDSVLDKLDKALLAVQGVKNTGWPNEHGDRVITFDVDKKTRYADILKAAKSLGVDFTPPDEGKTG